MSQDVYAKTMIYGIDKAQNYISHGKGPFYIQVASFRSQYNANSFVHQLKKRTPYSVNMKSHGSFYAVIIGPIASANEMRTMITKYKVPLISARPNTSRQTKPILAAASLVQPKTVQSKSSLEKEPRTLSRSPTNNYLRSHGYIQTDLGLSTSLATSSMQIFNGALDPYPANMDLFSTNKNHHGGMASVSAGLRWKQDRRYFPAYSLGLRYQNFFNQQIDGSITQYFDPEFVNYGYTLKTSSNVFSLFSKINLVQLNRFLPYASLGIGSTINRTGRYTERAYPGIVARIDSPNFNSQSSTQLSYNLGTGLDYQLNQNLLMSLGYEYQDLGAIRSGYGQFPWSGERLSLNHYKTSTALVSLSYSPGA
ncbi:SPOR domain-containing protein [Legionella bononiensis]|uniref:SPOR domain-containing protein n=1 Tax=Legionella bononiensis TaxID=2793102 RepID=UPI001EE49D97|nr:SPOR domain-containing protein [Legionella bononiensis]